MQEMAFQSNGVHTNMRTVVSRLLVRSHIAHCNHSRDYSIGMVEPRVTSDGAWRVRLHSSNTKHVSKCSEGTRNSKMIVREGDPGLEAGVA